MEADNTALASPDDANPDNDDIASSITELQNVLLGTESIEKFVQELAVQAAHLVAGSRGARGDALRLGPPHVAHHSSHRHGAVRDVACRLDRRDSS